MHSGRFTRVLLFFAISILAVTASCQKDSAVKELDAPKTNVTADSSAFSSPGNFLAASGTLKIKYNDSTYTFDAAKDSIAFINVRVDDQTHYFGITAINKEHNMSFGISSSGFAYSNINRNIAGSQFLLSTDNKKPVLQLSLSKYAGQTDFGNINIIRYNQGSELAKGTFHAFLAKDDKADAPFYRVEGTFDLKLK
ncbi:MAG TPA: hypothetical protein VIM16_20140 [Mucilaginibacter sp.]|jgi:hypothetical protein